MATNLSRESISKIIGSHETQILDQARVSSGRTLEQGEPLSNATPPILIGQRFA